MMKNFNELLVQSFVAHDVECHVENDAVIFPGRFIEAFVVVPESTNPKIMQIDVVFCMGLGQYLVESFAGVGNTPEDAGKDAWENFMRSSFHAILAGIFLPDSHDDMVTRKTLTVGGRTYVATIGQLSIRGKAQSAADGHAHEWVEQFEKDIATHLSLSNGVHWLRIFHAQGGENVMNEVLLDNETCESLKTHAETYSFPKSDSYSSVRLFLILKNEPDIARMAKIIAGLSDDEIQAVLVSEYGLSREEAYKAYALIQHAFGRVLLNNSLSIHFTDVAVVHDANGEVVEEIDLEQDPYFTGALELGRRILESGHKEDIDKFVQIAMTSAEVSAVNNAFSEGAEADAFNDAQFGDLVINL